MLGFRHLVHVGIIWQVVDQERLTRFEILDGVFMTATVALVLQTVDQERISELSMVTLVLYEVPGSCGASLSQRRPGVRCVDQKADEEGDR